MKTLVKTVLDCKAVLNNSIPYQQNINKTNLYNEIIYTMQMLSMNVGMYLSVAQLNDLFLQGKKVKAQFLE